MKDAMLVDQRLPHADPGHLFRLACWLGVRRPAFVRHGLEAQIQRRMHAAEHPRTRVLTP